MENWIASQIASQLVDRLPEDMADELKSLIARSEKNSDDPTTEIITLLAQHENSLLWFLEQLELQSEQKNGTRGYGPLAGDSSAPVSNKWICPKNKTESLPVIQEGEPAPQCEKHKIEMVRKK